MTEPDYRKWTPEAVRAFLAAQLEIDKLTADDLALYVKMRQTYDAAFGWPSTKSEQKKRDELYAAFRQARARWSAVISRLHPRVQTFTQEQP